MGARRKRLMAVKGGDLEMTPMIDVVFQLLIYFLVTMKPPDVSAHLDVFRPSAAVAPPSDKEPPKMIRIEIHQGAMLMNGRSVDLGTLTQVLEKLAAMSTTQTVLISCSRDSEHNDLVDVLDRCAKAKLTNLSVLSMN